MHAGALALWVVDFFQIVAVLLARGNGWSEGVAAAGGALSVYEWASGGSPASFAVFFAASAVAVTALWVLSYILLRELRNPGRRADAPKATTGLAGGIAVASAAICYGFALPVGRALLAPLTCATFVEAYAGGDAAACASVDRTLMAIVGALAAAALGCALLTFGALAHSSTPTSTTVSAAADGTIWLLAAGTRALLIVGSIVTGSGLAPPMVLGSLYTAAFAVMFGLVASRLPFFARTANSVAAGALALFAWLALGIAVAPTGASVAWVCVGCLVVAPLGAVAPSLKYRSVRRVIGELEESVQSELAKLHSRRPTAGALLNEGQLRSLNRLARATANTHALSGLDLSGAADDEDGGGGEGDVEDGPHHLGSRVAPAPGPPSMTTGTKPVRSGSVTKRNSSGSVRSRDSGADLVRILNRLYVWDVELIVRALSFTLTQEGGRRLRGYAKPTPTGACIERCLWMFSKGAASFKYSAPDLVTVKLAFASWLMAFVDDADLSASTLRTVPTEDGSLWEEFQVHLRVRELESARGARRSGNEDKLVGRDLKQALQLHRLALESQTALFACVAQRKREGRSAKWHAQLSHLVADTKLSVVAAAAEYDKVYASWPEASTVVTAYSAFAVDVLHDKVLSARLTSDDATAVRGKGRAEASTVASFGGIRRSNRPYVPKPRTGLVDEVSRWLSWGLAAALVIGVIFLGFSVSLQGSVRGSALDIAHAARVATATAAVQVRLLHVAAVSAGTGQAHVVFNGAVYADGEVAVAAARAAVLRNGGTLKDALVASVNADGANDASGSPAVASAWTANATVTTSVTVWDGTRYARLESLLDAMAAVATWSATAAHEPRARLVVGSSAALRFVRDNGVPTAVLGGRMLFDAYVAAAAGVQRLFALLCVVCGVAFGLAVSLLAYAVLWLGPRRVHDVKRAVTEIAASIPQLELDNIIDGADAARDRHAQLVMDNAVEAAADDDDDDDDDMDSQQSSLAAGDEEDAVKEGAAGDGDAAPAPQVDTAGPSSRRLLKKTSTALLLRSGLTGAHERDATADTAALISRTTTRALQARAAERARSEAVAVDEGEEEWTPDLGRLVFSTELPISPSSPVVASIAGAHDALAAVSTLPLELLSTPHLAALGAPRARLRMQDALDEGLERADTDGAESDGAAGSVASATTAGAVDVWVPVTDEADGLPEHQSQARSVGSGGGGNASRRGSSGHGVAAQRRSSTGRDTSRESKPTPALAPVPDSASDNGGTDALVALLDEGGVNPAAHGAAPASVAPALGPGSGSQRRAGVLAASPGDTMDDPMAALLGDVGHATAGGAPLATPSVPARGDQVGALHAVEPVVDDTEDPLSALFGDEEPRAGGGAPAAADAKSSAPPAGEPLVPAAADVVAVVSAAAETTELAAACRFPSDAKWHAPKDLLHPPPPPPLDRILAELNTCLFATDRCGMIVRAVGRELGSLLDYEASVLVGRAAECLMPADVAPAHRSMMLAAVSSQMVNAHGPGRHIGGPAMQVNAVARGGDVVPVVLTLNRATNAAGDCIFLAQISDSRRQYVHAHGDGTDEERLALTDRRVKTRSSQGRARARGASVALAILAALQIIVGLLFAYALARDIDFRDAIATTSDTAASVVAAQAAALDIAFGGVGSIDYSSLAADIEAHASKIADLRFSARFGDVASAMGAFSSSGWSSALVKLSWNRPVNVSGGVAAAGMEPLLFEYSAALRAIASAPAAFAGASASTLAAPLYKVIVAVDTITNGLGDAVAVLVAQNRAVAATYSTAGVAVSVVAILLIFAMHMFSFRRLVRALLLEARLGEDFLELLPDEMILTSAMHGYYVRAGGAGGK